MRFRIIAATTILATGIAVATYSPQSVLADGVAAPPTEVAVSYDGQPMSVVGSASAIDQFYDAPSGKLVTVMSETIQVMAANKICGAFIRVDYPFEESGRVPEASAFGSVSANNCPGGVNWSHSLSQNGTVVAHAYAFTPDNAVVGNWLYATCNTGALTNWSNKVNTYPESGNLYCHH